MHRPRSTLTLAACGALTALVLAACGEAAPEAESRITPAAEGQTDETTLPTGGSGPVVIASANFPENQILASVYEQALDAAGFDASVKPLTTRPVIVPQVTAGEIDVEPDYVGALTEYLNKEANGPDAPQIANGDLEFTLAQARELGAPRGLTILDASPAADQNAFAVTQDTAEEYDLETLSDLSRLPQPIALGGSPECQDYSLCMPGLESVYGLSFEFQQTDIGGPLAVAALNRGTVTVNQYLSSDGTAVTNGFVILEDDKQLAPVDNVIPVVGERYADDAVLRETLDKVSAAMTTDDLLNLNASLTVDRKLPAQAARDFLVGKGFLPS
jgi:osmoprotectant transport system substrate-binding protein